MEDKNQELTGYNNKKGLFYIKLHLQKYNLLMDTFIGPSVSSVQKIGITIDFLLCTLKYGAGINDYFQYNFYKRRAIDRKTFIVGRKWIRIIKTCNGTIAQPDFDDKSRFNSVFKDFIGRDWIDLDTCTQDEYESFVKRHPVSMRKKKKGSGGNGIGVYNSESEFKSLDDLKNKHFILEELIDQYDDLAEFNPSSVNTLRLVTIVHGDKVKLMNAVFRTGNGEGCTDNFHHYGLAALIDCKTGLVVTPAVDKKNNKFYIHPLSRKQIIGYKIPLWDEIVNTVKKAALIRPNVRYVGWDVSLDKVGNVCIIEGNCASDPDIIQMPDQIGKWPNYSKELEKWF